MSSFKLTCRVRVGGNAGLAYMLAGLHAGPIQGLHAGPVISWPLVPLWSEGSGAGLQPPHTPRYGYKPDG